MGKYQHHTGGLVSGGRKPCDDATVLFSYRTSPEARFTVMGELFKAVRGRWVGARMGLFSIAPEGAQTRLSWDDFRALPMRRERY